MRTRATDTADSLCLHDEVIFEEVLYKTRRHFEKLIQAMISGGKKGFGKSRVSLYRE